MMIKRVLSVLLLTIVCRSVSAQDIDPFKGPQPIAVLIQTDPWLMVIGSDTPMIAIYNNGLVVYEKREKEKEPVLFVKQLNTNELADVQKKLISLGDYKKLKRYYDLAPAITDLPETRIYLSPEVGDLVTTVYGLMVQDTYLPAYSTFGDKGKVDKLPAVLKELHEYLTSLDFTDATPWTPPYVEVMIWGYDYAPEDSIHWPKEWPGLDSPSTLKRRDAYSIFLPGTDLPRLRDFLKTQKEKGAVEISGKKWAASVRFTFPGEPIWRRKFRDDPPQKEQ